MPNAIRDATLAVLTSLAVAAPGAAQPVADTATYSSHALGTLVAAASRDNRVPPGLVSYRAAVESEIALALRREDGTETVVAVEQVASTLRWTRAGYYDQHVVGYRARQAVPTTSVMSVLPTGWVAPTLYGERLLPPPPPDSVRGARRPRAPSRRGTTTIGVHPLAADRERYYRFAGGDTVATLRVGGRAIPIVRVRVEPRAEFPAATSNVSLFLGDVDLDAERGVVVRMRGQFVFVTRPKERLAARVAGRVARAAMRGYAFVDYETSEHDGRYWLPAYQRLEFQAVAPVMGETRAVMRVVSRLRDVALNDTTLPALAGAAADTAARAPRWWRLTRAPGDTVRGYDAWRDALGTATSPMHADDFDDVAPDAWRRAGPPRAEPWVARGSDALRFNRVEGLFTGAGARVRFRDAAPGLTLRAAGGWAWGERAARGRVEIERESVRDRDTSTARWALGIRAARSLDLTNDFRRSLDSGASFPALLGSVDAYDYVDRRSATLFVRRTLSGRAAAVRAEVGAASDGGPSTSVTQGLLAGETPFRPNRGVDAGSYVRSALTFELRPDVSAEFVRPGLGGRVFYERGDGDLRYQRVEARVVGRRELHVAWPGILRGSTLTAHARGDVGALFAAEPPPQQLFELGGAESLQGYDYKTFAGDRGALARGSIVYGSPWLRTPIRLARFAFPGVAPGLSVGIESGATWASSDAARRSIERLGPRDYEGSLSRPSAGTRVTLLAGARFFGGGFFVGAARPLDRHADRPRGWRSVVAVGAAL